MFIDNAVKDSIMNSANKDEFIKYVRKYRNLIHNMKNEFKAKIIEIAKTETSVDTKIIDAFYYESSVVSETEFEILEAYINNIPILWSSDSDNLPDRYSVVILLMSMDKFNSEAIIPTGVAKPFLSGIMDLYIPSEFPVDVVDVFTTIFSLKDMIMNVKNQSYFSDMVASSSDKIDPSIDMGDFVNLFYKTIDVLTHRELQIESFIMWHNIYVNIIFKVFDTREKIHERYFKYFEDDIVIMVADLLDGFNSFTCESDLQFFLSSFIADIMDNPNMKDRYPILKCLILDTLELSSGTLDACQYTIIKDALRKILSDDSMNQKMIVKVKPVMESSFKGNVNGLSVAIETYKKDSVAIHKGETEIYSAYKKYKDHEDKIDAQVSKAVDGMKKVLIGDVRSEIIEGKKFSAIGLLKKALGTVAIFAVSPIKALCVLLVKYALKKNTTVSEKRKIILELQAELEMINEKIDDAKSDGDREAKYAMMRTRTELQNALTRIRYGLEADEKSIATAKKAIGIGKR